MKRGTFNFIQWAFSITSTILLIFASIYGPEHYREKGRIIATDKYETEMFLLTIEKTKAEIDSRNAEVKMNKAFNEKKAAQIERDSAIAKQRRCEQGFSLLKEENQKLISYTDSLRHSCDSLFTRVQLLDEQLCSASIRLASMQSDIKRSARQLSLQEAIIKQKNEEKDLMHQDVLDAKQILDRHYCFRFMFLALLVIIALFLYATYKEWVSLETILPASGGRRQPCYLP